MTDLKRVEVAAMWFYHDQYATSGLSAVAFYQQLAIYEQNLMKQMVDDIVGAQP